MKHVLLTLLIASLLAACGRTEKTRENTTQSTTATTDSTAATDSAVATAAKPQNCQSVVEADKLGKPNEYQESAKPIKVSLTLNQDASTMQTADGCYFNNTVTVLATKKSGKQLFKRTMLKDDLLYFIKTDEAVEQAILKNVLYKPTFNSQKYITLTMRLAKPGTKKTMDYTMFMNYFGEIVKVK